MLALWGVRTYRNFSKKHDSKCASSSVCGNVAWQPSDAFGHFTYGVCSTFIAACMGRRGVARVCGVN